MKKEEPGKRFAALLLFQFRVMVDGDPGKRRICENRILNLRAANARMALTAAKRRGREAQYSYRNNDGNPVHFEFVGVRDLLHLGSECQSDEVWYEIVRLVKPMERKKEFIPAESKLNAIRHRK